MSILSKKTTIKNIIRNIVAQSSFRRGENKIHKFISIKV